MAITSEKAVALRRSWMMSDLGVAPVRRLNSRGRPAPHMSLQFDSHLFSIDTSRSPSGCAQPDAYLITHAHSDHYGASGMLSPRSVASVETARALEIRHKRRYMGRTFEVGEQIEVNGVKIKTYPTAHAPGSTAFFWENEVGCKILVTGDVKEYRYLPSSDLLVTEANYGDPLDPECRFDDDIAGFEEALRASATFGAYAFGKAQRAVSLMRAMGYSGEIGMDEQCLALTSELLKGAGPFIDWRENIFGVNVVTPASLQWIASRNKFLLTGRSNISYPKIRLSDHLDFRGLLRMIDHVSPSATVVYHPEGSRADSLARHLRGCGMSAVSVSQIEKVLR
jgi:putative mRNA 3-end processing factor